MNIDPRRLVVLRAVDRHGGVVGAAEALHISPSAVSQQLALLERETGFALIDRSRRGGQRSVAFTTAGRRLVAHAGALVQVLDDAAAELSSLADAVTGPVTLTAFVTALRGFAGAAIVDVGAGSTPDSTCRCTSWTTRPPPPMCSPAAPTSPSSRTTPSAAAPYRVGCATNRSTTTRSASSCRLDWPEFDDLAAVADRPWIDGPPASAVGQAMRRVRRDQRADVARRAPVPGLHRGAAAGVGRIRRRTRAGARADRHRRRATFARWSCPAWARAASACCTGARATNPRRSCARCWTRCGRPRSSQRGNTSPSAMRYSRASGTEPATCTGSPCTACRTVTVR